MLLKPLKEFHGQTICGLTVKIRQLQRACENGKLQYSMPFKERLTSVEFLEDWLTRPVVKIQEPVAEPVKVAAPPRKGGRKAQFLDV